MTEKTIIFRKSDSVKLISGLCAFVNTLEDDKEYTLTVKEYKKKRSLDANAYCFVLIGKIAEKLNIPKEEVYRNAIKQIGGNHEIVCVKNEALKKLCEVWCSRGLGWQVDTFPSKIDGCTNVILYYGSSVYDSKQMSLLIDNIIEDCRSLEIETLTPRELQALKDAWN